MKVRNFTVLLLCLLIFVSCSESQKDSGTTTPSTLEPYIIDAILCLGVINGKPAGITNVFTADDIVHIWIEWDNIYDENTVSVNWLEPDGHLEAADEVTFNSRNGRKVTWFSLDPGSPADVGFWEIEIFLNGEFQRSYLFELI